MGRIFVSGGTGAAVYVFSNDHCPAHVHAHHRGEGWIARVRFSYLSTTVELMSIMPTRNIPLQRVVNRLLSDVQDRLLDCRRSWWTSMRTACLANQWALIVAPGKIDLVVAGTSAAKQIADAQYDPATERLRVDFQDGASEEVRLRP